MCNPKSRSAVMNCCIYMRFPPGYPNNYYYRRCIDGVCPPVWQGYQLFRQYPVSDCNQCTPYSGPEWPPPNEGWTKVQVQSNFSVIPSVPPKLRDSRCCIYWDGRSYWYRCTSGLCPTTGPNNSIYYDSYLVDDCNDCHS